MEASIKNQTMHTGQKIAHVRKLRGVKQETLANELGISQAEFSNIENAAIVDDNILNQIAEILNVPSEAIKNFDESLAVYYINNKIENSTIQENGHGIHQVFSPIDKVVELYERLLESEKEKIRILLNKKK
ncbi:MULTISPECIES: helix-turn-helix domain-containing protein [Aequorivita]|uniref:Helix-turn-helix transcriptional regulator n=1 Tax=Aequorivita iocasae TaxID=2803865 RepID=A0ABX7DPE6_9FLAO|nr:MULTISPECIES: helix-turn-helix transcriptional regulator [Aequorivita]QQX76010.1 helix-turn-helix transcriptional regulator [Aequorivita iocasae]UCA55471.1 helix-turn-helix transcriptional regulator [Aequorivita sp. F7]